MKLLPYIHEKDHVLPLVGIKTVSGPSNITGNANAESPQQVNSINGESQQVQAGRLLVQDGTLYSPRPGDQALAIDNVCKGFETNDRGKLILPCGVGKTLTSLWIKEKIKPKITLALFPSISLLGQTRDVWMEQRRNKFESICVCSDKTVADKKSGQESEDEELKAMEHSSMEDLKQEGALVTTDSEQIAKQIQAARDGNGDLVIFSTYQSLRKIQEALAATGEEIDLTICDEAHNTAGKEGSNFTLVHDDEKIPSKKRLYMTATERIIENFDGTEEEKELLYDMDNPKVFGPTFHKMSFREAMDQGIITEYKLLAVSISEEELNNLGIKKDDPALKNYILQKAMQETNAKHALSFHSRATGTSKNSAEAFAERHRKISSGVDVFHVNGTMPASERKKVLKEQFSKSACAVLTNARCLREGVDAKGIDMVYFTSPKSSVIDIVQGASRAFRKDSNNPNKIGYIVIPIIYSKTKGMKPDDSSYNILVNTVAALAEHDERLVDALRLSSNNPGDPRDDQDELTKEANEYLDKHFQLTGLKPDLIKIMRMDLITDSRKVIQDLMYPSFTLAAETIRKKIPQRPKTASFQAVLTSLTGLTLAKLQKLYKKSFPEREINTTKSILDEIYGIKADTDLEPEREPYRNFIELAKAVRERMPVRPNKDEYFKNIQTYIGEKFQGITDFKEMSNLYRQEVNNREPAASDIFEAIWSIDIEDRICPYQTDLEAIDAIHKLGYTKMTTAKELFTIDSKLRKDLHLTVYKLRELFNMPDAGFTALKDKIFSVENKYEVKALPVKKQKVQHTMSVDEAIKLLRRDFSIRPSTREIEEKSGLSYTRETLIENTGSPSIISLAFYPHSYSNFKQVAAAVWEATSGQAPENLEELFNSKFLTKNIGINLFDLRKLYGNGEASYEELKAAIYNDGSISHLNYDSYLDVLEKLNQGLKSNLYLLSDSNGVKRDSLFIQHAGISRERMEIILGKLKLDSLLSRFAFMQSIENLSNEKITASAAPRNTQELCDLLDDSLAKGFRDHSFWSSINKQPLIRLILAAKFVKKNWGEEVLQSLLINTISTSNIYSGSELNKINGITDDLSTAIAMSPEEFCKIFELKDIKEIFTIKSQSNASLQNVSESITIKQQLLLKAPEAPEDLIRFFMVANNERDKVSLELSEQKRADLTVVDMATQLWGEAIPGDYWFKQLKILYPTRPANLETVFGRGAAVNSTRTQQEKDVNAIFLAAYRKLFPKQLTPDYKLPPAFWQKMLANRVWPV